MGTLRKIKRLLTAIALLFIVSLGYSQTLKEATDSFNEGVKAQQENRLGEAIQYFNECLDICYESEEEGVEELQLKVESSLPKLHLQLAKDFYQAKKIDEAIEQFKLTAQVAAQFGDSDTENQANKVVPQLYTQVGISKYKRDDFQGSLSEFKNAVEFSPDYVSAYYYIMLVYKQLDNEAELKNTAEKGIEMALNANDDKNYERISGIARDYFLSKGNSAKESANYSDAENYLKQSISYDDKNATAYYLLTSVYNAQANWSAATDAAKKALQFEDDDPEKESKIYFELANAYKEKGDSTSACEAYKKAAFGAYEEAAKYQLEHILKCN
ncbi:MAG: hypothetical protein JXJ22_16195 [Bacteroidales bacterium]|nr:hypothetical protein [Bacteroidales bacterium]